MDNRIVVLLGALACLGAATAGVLGPPQYSYGYDVADSLTGDYKGHTEQRTGDLVTGSYSVLDADGTRRVVDYTADPLNGFNAVVRRELPLPPAPVAVPAAPVYPRAPVFAPAPLLAPRPYYF